MVRTIEFLKRWKFVAMFLSMLFVFAYVVVKQSNQQTIIEAQIERSLVNDIEDDYDSCLSRTDLRETMYVILDSLANGTISASAAFDLINVIGYEDLDPAVQTYLLNLDHRIHSENEDLVFITRVRDQYKEEAPIPDCEAERLDAERRLRAELDGGR